MPELPPSIAQHYHERTKYDPETIAAKSKQLDWTEQPVPFKEYKIGAYFDLKPYLKDPSEDSDADPDAGWWHRLSSLLLCSYGLTAKVQTVDDSYLYLRSAPSAGGLYPAEVYLISRGTAQLPAGTLQLSVQNSFTCSFLGQSSLADLASSLFSVASARKYPIGDRHYHCFFSFFLALRRPSLSANFPRHRSFIEQYRVSLRRQRLPTSPDWRIRRRSCQSITVHRLGARRSDLCSCFSRLARY